jgi:hypothetical protein
LAVWSRPFGFGGLIGIRISVVLVIPSPGRRGEERCKEFDFIKRFSNVPPGMSSFGFNNRPPRGEGQGEGCIRHGAFRSHLTDIGYIGARE